MKPLEKRTPKAWAQLVLQDPGYLLLDHLQCEMKAATTALSLISKNSERAELIAPMLQVAQEELAHYGLIHQIVVRRGYQPEPIMPSPYMSEMLKRSSKTPHKPFLDRLLIAALVEARSCERFRLLSETTDDEELRHLFDELVGPEASHFNLYLDLAKKFYAEKEVMRRFEQLSALESQVLSELPADGALHSGWKNLEEEAVSPKRMERIS